MKKQSILLVLILIISTMTTKASEPTTKPSFDVKIRTVEPFEMLYYEYTGPYEQSFNDFENLMAYIQQKGIAMGPYSVGLFYDDPQEVPAENLRSEPGIMVQKNFAPEEPYKCKTVDGGKAVTVKYHSMEEIMPAYQAIAEYIEANKLETKDYSLEIYYSFDPNTIDTEIVMFLK